MAGRNIYVSPSGSNANPGTISSPMATITAALAVTPSLGAGDKITVMDGTYGEQVVVNRGGDATGDFSVVAQNPLGAKIRAPSNVYSAVNIIKSYVTFDGFDVNTAGTGHGIEATFIDGNSANDGPHHITVKNCVSHDNAGGGIEFAYGDFYLIDNNICYGNCATNQYQGSGISIYEPRAVAGVAGTRITISRNTCYLNQAYNLVGGGQHSDANGIIIDDFRHTQQGGHPAYAYNTLVENNVCYLNGAKGIHVFFSDLVTVRNNSCWRNNLDNLNPATWRGEIDNLQSSSNTFVNNIAYCDPTANSYNTAYSDACFGGYVNTNVNWYSNLSFNGTVGQASLNLTGSGTPFTSTLVATAPYNNVLGVNPLFVSAGVGVTTPDLHLQSTSPARNTGISTYGVSSFDRDGKTRVSGGAIDFGAYEIQNPGPTIPAQGTSFGNQKVKTIRQMCVESDPNFYDEGRRPTTYEFGGRKRKFREVTDISGPYKKS